MQVFFTCIDIQYTYMFLKQENSEMDDFEERKTLVLKEKLNNFQVLTDILAKMSQNIFVYYFRNILSSIPKNMFFVNYYEFEKIIMVC